MTRRKTIWLHVTIPAIQRPGAAFQPPVDHVYVEGINEADALERFQTARGVEAEYWVAYRNLNEAVGVRSHEKPPTIIEIEES